VSVVNWAVRPGLVQAENILVSPVVLLKAKGPVASLRHRSLEEKGKAKMGSRPARGFSFKPK
jgi:hypothetical protein